jgi:hypothetical protein
MAPMNGDILNLFTSVTLKSRSIKLGAGEVIWSFQSLQPLIILAINYFVGGQNVLSSTSRTLRPITEIRFLIIQFKQIEFSARCHQGVAGLNNNGNKR